MGKAPTENDIKALAGLLTGDQETAVCAAREKLSSLSPEFISFLHEISRQENHSEVRNAAGIIIDEIRLVQLGSQFQTWIQARGPRHLEDGALLVAAFAYPQIDGAFFRGELDRMADEVRKRLDAGKDPERNFYLLSKFLFQDLGFRGNSQCYYDPDNSYLNKVLERKTGLPITLSVLLLALGERLDLPLLGVGMPGHFMVKFQAQDKNFFIDAFNQGRVLSREDCRNWLIASGNGFKEEYLATVSDRDILGRMLRNLICVYTQNSDSCKVRNLTAFLRIVSPEYKIT